MVEDAEESPVIKKISHAKKKWEEACVEPAMEQSPERQADFKNLSDTEIKRLYTPEEVQNLDYFRDLGFPGEYPYTRGPYPRCTGANCGRCGNLLGWEALQILTDDSNTSLSKAKPASRPPSTSRPCTGGNPAMKWHLGKWARTAWRSTRWQIWKSSLTASICRKFPPR